MLAQGINASKACVLIALDTMFDREYEGRYFLHDMFVEHWNDTGIAVKDFYLLEECADVVCLPSGKMTMNFCQGDKYVEIFIHSANIRYRISSTKRMIYVYSINDKMAHAICIHASEFLTMLNMTTYCAALLPRKGLIVDYKEYREETR